MNKYQRLLTNDYQLSSNYNIFPIHSIMQNKPNFPYFSPGNEDYAKNKAKTNPNKPNFRPISRVSKPIQTQFKPNFPISGVYGHE